MLEFICYFNGSKLWYEFKDIFSKKKETAAKHIISADIVILNIEFGAD